MDYALLGKRIRDERLLLRLTIEQLAERVDKSTPLPCIVSELSSFINQVLSLFYID